MIKGYKRKLALLQTPVDAFPEGLDITPTSTVQNHWRGEVHNFVYTARRENNMLAVTVFTPGGDFLYRAFQWTDDFFTHFADEDKPSESTISSAQQRRYITRQGLSGVLREGLYGKYIAAADADDVISKFFKDANEYGFWYGIRSKSMSGFDLLEKYQLYLRERAVKERNDRIRAAINDDMLVIRELPKKVIDWIDAGPLKSSRYIFYTYKKSKKGMPGTCSHCKKEVIVQHPKHRGTGVCPACRSRVTYIADGVFMRGSGFTDESSFAYYQPTPKGSCLRLYRVKRNYGVNYDKHCCFFQDKMYEYARVFLDERFQPQKTYEWGDFRQTGVHDWCNGYNGGYIGQQTYIYHGNLKELTAKDPRMKYAQIPEIAKYCGRIPPDALMSEPLEYPWIEYLIKLKLYRLAAEVINDEPGWGQAINRNGKNLKEILSIGKEDVRSLQALNVTADALRVYQGIKGSGKRIDAKTIGALRWLMDNLDEPAGICGVINNFDVPPHKAVKYVQEQRAGKKKEDYPSWDTPKEERILREIANDWADYLRQCVQLEYDLSEAQICYPRDLDAAHARASALVDNKKHEKHDMAVKARVKSLERQYKFEADGIIIRPPYSAGEIVAEGKMLNHCVGGYTESHAQGGTTILFIRKADRPDIPFYTLECHNDKVIQCRGKRNCSPTPEVEKFMKKWKKKKLEPPVLHSNAKEPEAEAAAPERVMVGA